MPIVAPLRGFVRMSSCKECFYGSKEIVAGGGLLFLPLLLLVLITSGVSPAWAATRYSPYVWESQLGWDNATYQSLPAMMRNDARTYTLGCNASKCDNTNKDYWADKDDSYIGYVTLSDEGIAYDRKGNALPSIGDELKIISLAPLKNIYGEYQSSDYNSDDVLAALASNGKIYTIAPPELATGKPTWPQWKELQQNQIFTKIVGTNIPGNVIYGLTASGTVHKLTWKSGKRITDRDVSNGHIFKDITIWSNTCTGSGSGWGGLDGGCAGGLGTKFYGLTSDNNLYNEEKDDVFALPQKAKAISPQAFLTENNKVIHFALLDNDTRLFTEDTGYYAKHLEYGFVETYSYASSSTGYSKTTDWDAVTTFSGSTRPIVDTNTLSFSLNGAPGSDPGKQSLKPTEKTVKPNPDPVWDGYRFDGWYTSSKGGSLFVFGGTIASDKTLYAHWSPVNAAMPATGVLVSALPISAVIISGAGLGMALVRRHRSYK